MVDSIIKLLSTFLDVIIVLWLYRKKNLHFQKIHAKVFTDEEFQYLQFLTGTSKKYTNRSNKYSKLLTTVELRGKVYKCSLYYFNFSIYLKFFRISWEKSIELYKNTQPKPAKSVSYMCISISIGARRTFRNYGMAFRGISSLKLNLYLHSSPGDSRAIAFARLVLCCNCRETHISSIITTSIKQNLTSLYNLLPKSVQHPPHNK